MTQRIEIYCRFASDKGCGLHETPSRSLEEAACQFTEDADIVSALAMSFDEAGRLTAAEDVTSDVLAVIRANIQNGVYETCPHPIFDAEFETYSQERDAENLAEEEHRTIEGAMLHI